jgi:hypothetical protein
MARHALHDARQFRGLTSIGGGLDRADMLQALAEL